MLEPYVKRHVGNQENFNTEIDKVIKKELPEFEEYAKEIKAYAADYFGVE
ncbi:MAG: hypothetical protein Q3M24_10525 [Candidatus Electrothrix aestuarii]|uniref:Uncharacterized protein n=1 Tax=Candidatus Electrothrix aestuarii TaxID=3062594 RepID=A0AAU8M265_9BACT